MIESLKINILGICYGLCYFVQHIHGKSFGLLSIDP